MVIDGKEKANNWAASVHRLALAFSPDIRSCLDMKASGTPFRYFDISFVTSSAVMSACVFCFLLAFAWRPSRCTLVDCFENLVRIYCKFQVKHLCVWWKACAASGNSHCYFLSAGPTKPEQMKKLFLHVTDRLIATVLSVETVVCDQGADNCSLFTKLE